MVVSLVGLFIAISACPAVCSHSVSMDRCLNQAAFKNLKFWGLNFFRCRTVLVSGLRTSKEEPSYFSRKIIYRAFISKTSGVAGELQLLFVIIASHRYSYGSDEFWITHINENLITLHLIRLGILRSPWKLDFIIHRSKNAHFVLNIMIPRKNESSESCSKRHMKISIKSNPMRP